MHETTMRSARALTTSRRFLALAGIVAAAAVAPVTPALAAPAALPDAWLQTVREAGGQLFWVGTAEGKSDLYTRPTAGGAVRSLGSVPGPSGPAAVAFDGTRYVVAINGWPVDESGQGIDEEGDCGVCEGDSSRRQQLIAGTLDGTPKVIFDCLTGNVDAPAPEVAIAAGRTFFASVVCGGPAGIGTVDAAGAATSFDPAGTVPLAGAGTWLSYAAPGYPRATDLAGGGSFATAVAYAPNAAKPVSRAWLLQADGSLFVGGRFFRTGGTTPAVPLSPDWRTDVPETLFAGDRLFYGDLTALSVTSPQGARAIVASGMGAKRPLSLVGSALNVAGYSCTGEVGVQALDLGAATPRGALDGCPVKVTTGALRMTKKRTITVAVSCANGCAGTLNLVSRDVPVSAAVKAPVGGTATVRFRLNRTQARFVKRSARFTAGSSWLTVNRRSHRLSVPRSNR
jgi:hypothetical protein